jgi:4-amino-4-deoxy-L-arabinose transferase-like glycosyltransferase
MIITSSSSKQKKELLLILLFFLVNLALYIFSVEGATFTEGADATQYYNPAISLIQNGSFNSNSEAFTFGTPLYSILLAIPISIFGIDQASLMIVVIQCFLLYATGIVARKFSVIFLKKESFLLHSIIIFNPNSLITAHLVQSETLFTLLLTISVYFLFKLIEKNSFKYTYFLGLSLGLLTLTRPAGLYFIYFIPVVYLISIMFRDKAFISLEIRKYIFRIIVLILTSLLVVSPWYARNYSLFGEAFLSSNSGAYLKDQYSQLLRVGNNWSGDEALEKIELEIRSDYTKNNVSKLCLEKVGERRWSCDSDLTRVMVSGILSEPVNSHIYALFYSWSNLYLAGGASNIRNYLGIPGKNKIVSFDQGKYGGVDDIISLIRSIDFSYLFILIFTTAFSITSRILGLVGIYSLVKDRNMWPYLIVLMGIIILLTGMYLYLGQSRFRVPMEPILMLLSVIGFYNIKIRNIGIIQRMANFFRK